MKQWRKESCFPLLVWDCFPASAAFGGKGWCCWSERGKATERESGVGQRRIRWSHVRGAKQICGMRFSWAGLPITMTAKKKKKYISKYNSKLPSQILYIATGRDSIKVIVHITSANKDVFQNINACISLNYTFKNMIKDYIKCRHISVAEDWWSSKKLPESSAGLDNSVHFKWSLLIISAKGLATWTILCCGYWVFTVDGFHFFLGIFPHKTLWN